RNRSHWSTSKTPSYTKSVSWQHHRLYGGAARHGTRQPALCPADGFDSMRDHVVIVTAIAAAPRDVVYQSVS
ncbi:hypothetical protein, partial [Klebsiella pneumoniae]|uniref:hypothetical protein n=1 Tax=Klebsiella pneumoniae TaxID=573 RepID=UPI001CA32541